MYEAKEFVILEPVKPIHGANLGSDELLYVLEAQTTMTVRLWHAQLVRTVRKRRLRQVRSSKSTVQRQWTSGFCRQDTLKSQQTVSELDLY